MKKIQKMRMEREKKIIANESISSDDSENDQSDSGNGSDRQQRDGLDEDTELSDENNEI